MKNNEKLKDWQNDARNGLEQEVEHQREHVVNHFEPGANCQVFNGPVSGCVFAMPGSAVTQQPPAPAAGVPPTAAQQRDAEVETLVACVDAVRQYFWCPSSLSVIFCVCRDNYYYPNNMSQFERDFRCSQGLLSNTFRNNPYMRLHIDKWRQNGAKDRVLRLVDAYQTAVRQAVAGNIPTA